MGTNFYLVEPEPKLTLSDDGETRFIDLDSPEVHIGKRSAAGLYCWDCRVTLCRGGEAGIHYSISGWYTRCPRCHKSPVKEGVAASAAGRELGFNRSTPQAKTGVASCSSFSWAMSPERFSLLPDTAVIEDEYNRRYTKAEFMTILTECPVQFQDSIGTRFC